MFKPFWPLALIQQAPTAINSEANNGPQAAWELRQLAIAVPGGRRLATVNAVLRPGRVTAILGPNGAGKSSLLRTLTGEWPAQGGQVLEAGRPLLGQPAAQFARRRAVMPQDGSVAFDFSVQEVVELGRYAHRLQPSRDEAGIVAQAMAATGVTGLAARSIITLSGGERARAHLARALAQIWDAPPCGSARWLLLDEPTAAMDLAYQHHTMALLRRWAHEQQVGVVAVLHDANLALRYADEVLLVHAGGCEAGTVQRVLTAETLARVWGVACHAATAPDGVAQYLFSSAG
ncbi:heme ABC transporter ATP-binding protein [Comamonas humi]